MHSGGRAGGCQIKDGTTLDYTEASLGYTMRLDPRVGGEGEREGESRDYKATMKM